MQGAVTAAEVAFVGHRTLLAGWTEPGASIVQPGLDSGCTCMHRPMHPASLTVQPWLDDRGILLRRETDVDDKAPPGKFARRGFMYP